MRGWLVEYFTFTQKERIGVLVLLGLLASVWLLPMLWRVSIKDRVPKVYLNKADSIGSRATVPIRTLRPFDPNKITDEDWRQLGLQERNIRTIRNYLSKGGRFRKPDALLSVYGIDTAIVRQLLPFVRLEEANNRRSGFSTAVTPLAMASLDTRFKTLAPKRPVVLDLNNADSASLEALPWIGEKLASRIVRYRDACGGFYAVDQLLAMYGMSDTIFLHFKPYLSIGKGHLRKIRVNTAPADSLTRHPYIQFRQARALVAYRNEHGTFQRLDDLLLVPAVDKVWLELIRPYLSLE